MSKDIEWVVDKPMKIKGVNQMMPIRSQKRKKEKDTDENKLVQILLKRVSFLGFSEYC